MGSICMIIDHINPYVTFGKALGHIVANFRDYIISPYVTFGKALQHIVANFRDYIISPYATFGKALGHTVANFRDYTSSAHAFSEVGQASFGCTTHTYE